MRYYRLLGNKLKETCSQNTGIMVKEQHAQGEGISKTGIRVRDINHLKTSEEDLKGIFHTTPKTGIDSAP